MELLKTMGNINNKSVEISDNLINATIPILESTTDFVDRKQAIINKFKLMGYDVRYWSFNSQPSDMPAQGVEYIIAHKDEQADIFICEPNMDFEWCAVTYANQIGEAQIQFEQALRFEIETFNAE